MFNEILKKYTYKKAQIIFKIYCPYIFKVDKSHQCSHQCRRISKISNSTNTKKTKVMPIIVLLLKNKIKSKILKGFYENLTSLEQEKYLITATSIFFFFMIRKGNSQTQHFLTSTKKTKYQFHTLSLFSASPKWVENEIICEAHRLGTQAH